MQTTSTSIEALLVEPEVEQSLPIPTWQRKKELNIPKRAVQAALDYGREVHVGGATICALGRQEIKRLRKIGIDLSDLNGVQVICDRSGKVLKAYKDRDLHALRERGRRRCFGR